MLNNINSFGSYGDVYIIKSTTYGGGGAQNGTLYLGLTGGGTNIITLELSTHLIEGKSYSFSFYDRKTASYNVSPIQIGLSNSMTEVGTIIRVWKNIIMKN